MEHNIKKFIAKLHEAKSIILFSHVGPDGDTLGSLLALKKMIYQIDPNKKVDGIIFGKIPDVYKFLPDINELKNINDKDLYSNYDVAIALDCASPDRLGDAIDLFRNSKIKVNIDHHITNPNYADINIIEGTASSCGQIIYDLAKIFKINISKDIATCLYTAILTDTGGFKFNNTNAKTLRIAADLLELGVDNVSIFKECYESKPLPMVKLLSASIASATFIENNKIAYSTVSRSLLHSLNATDDHVDGISEALRQISGVEIALVFKETPKGDTKISFRSNKIDVCQIAKFFGGGGHKLAAGCTIQKNIDNSINELMPIVIKQLKLN